ncbi:N-acetylglucosamine-1-phosphodiester alpha-N-acetylglucosaminidase-like [Diadema setosum]|uniref:N-acetylglucosamine-1-phosphodiester alpha-N-acetylglucosaminidase-like n=1 Tax=Diadema setosum TaxID=31175 RepID=UPI003B3ACE7D
MTGTGCDPNGTGSGLPSEDLAVTRHYNGMHCYPVPYERILEHQPPRYGNVTHLSQKGHGKGTPGVQYPIASLKFFFDDFPAGQRVPGHIAWINNPARTFSVLEPSGAGGCADHLLTTVAVSARQENCLLAVNAGFFDTSDGGCLGAVVSNGRQVKTSGELHNAHFGIREDGTLVFGYLTEEDVLQKENPFIQLVGGVGWLIRDGEVYIEESRKACDEVVRPGIFDTLSARVAVGSDEEGRVVIAQTDGQTMVRGTSLVAFAEWLLSQGVRNAINLDGGGSTTLIINGTMVNIPSDICTNSTYRCPRKVSTIVCVHEPWCNPRDCSNHGDCIRGECRCHDDWYGPSCDQFACSNHTSPVRCHGVGECLTNFLVSKQPALLPSELLQEYKLPTTLLATAIATASILCNVICLIGYLCSCKITSEPLQGLSTNTVMI